MGGAKRRREEEARGQPFETKYLATFTRPFAMMIDAFSRGEPLKLLVTDMLVVKPRNRDFSSPL